MSLESRYADMNALLHEHVDVPRDAVPFVTVVCNGCGRFLVAGELGGVDFCPECA